MQLGSEGGLLYYTLLFNCLKDGKRLFKTTKWGTYKENRDNFCDELRAGGANVIIKSSNEIEDVYFVFSSGYISIQKSGPYIVCILCSMDSIDFERFKSIIDNGMKELEKEPKGRIFSLVTNGNDMKIVPIGVTKLPFEKENYNEEVIGDLEHAISDINSTNPCGKLTILDGVPGTGKTSLVRMLTDVINRPFILVQAHNIINWAGPAIINLLLNTRDEFEWPLVFVIEDADECLVPRKEGDMNAISVLLNMSDGILGSVFDIRIIATTNALIEDLDTAILREGRLCRRIKVGPLGVKQSNKVYQRLSKKDDSPFLKEATLAEIYKYVKDPSGATIMKKNQTKRIGFGNA